MLEKDTRADVGGKGGGKERKRDKRFRHASFVCLKRMTRGQLPFGVLFRPNGISFASRQCDDRPFPFGGFKGNEKVRSGCSSWSFKGRLIDNAPRLREIFKWFATLRSAKLLLYLRITSASINFAVTTYGKNMCSCHGDTVTHGEDKRMTPYKVQVPDATSRTCNTYKCYCISLLFKLRL